MYNISGTLLLLVLLTTEGSRGHKLAQTSLDEAECRKSQDINNVQGVILTVPHDFLCQNEEKKLQLIRGPFSRQY